MQKTIITKILNALGILFVITIISGAILFGNVKTVYGPDHNPLGLEITFEDLGKKVFKSYAKPFYYGGFIKQITDSAGTVFFTYDRTGEDARTTGFITSGKTEISTNYFNMIFAMRSFYFNDDQITGDSSRLTQYRNMLKNIATDLECLPKQDIRYPVRSMPVDWEKVNVKK